jgi:putative colanic acid biosynthesis UDP-glucose lipid carrier transferase
MTSFQPSVFDSELSASDFASLFFIKTLFYPVGIVICLIVSLSYWGIYFSGPMMLLAVLAFLVSLHVLDTLHLYRYSTTFPWLRAILDLLLRWLVILLVLWLSFDLAGYGYLREEPAVITWALFTPVALLTGQLLVRTSLKFWLKYRGSNRKAIIVGLNQIGLALADKIRQDSLLRIEILGFFDDREMSRLPTVDEKLLLGILKEIPEFVQKQNINTVYIAMPMARQPRILDLLEALRDSTASIYFVPDVFIADLIQARIDRIGGMPIVAVCESPFYGIRAVIKRLSDIVLAATILLLITPLLAAIAIAVKIDSKGPVLFKQRRYGLDGLEIIVYKFRSMTVCEDGVQVQQATRNDQRITRLGRFLRKTSLDELPQFINVLQGRMSVVGPRPHAVAHNEAFRKLIEGYMIRHKVKPGVTGWAQVNGFRGETDTLDKMEGRIQYDLDYLRNWSLALDLLIVFRTFGVLLGQRNAY